MILQAQEYEKAQGINLQEFFDSTKGKFQTELGRSWAAEIVARRAAAIQHEQSS
jgi:putative hydrolase of HD superfamily